jgi:DNA (cytosine-5)-methyltransferase 1
MGRGSQSPSRASVRVLDLFSGAGGLSTGFALASKRYSTVRAVESDEAAAASYAANHGDDKVYAGTIEDWLRGEDVPPAELVIGGPPCQGFSALGKQDVLDTRNQLWLRYAETIRKAQPKYFVLENVPAFLKSVHYERFRQQCEPKRQLGAYTFRAVVLNAADYGAAQVRKRVILIGHHRDLVFPGFPKPTHAPDDWVTLKDVLAGRPERVRRIDLPNRWIDVGDKFLPGEFRTDELHLARHYEDLSLIRMAHIPPGGNRFDIPDDLLARCWREHTSGAADVMGRLSWDKPSVTIRTEFFKPEKGRYLHPTEHRALTHHEAARIQGFPDDYKWVGAKGSIARQIGNAVPIPLGRAIGKHLLQHL